MVYLYTGSQNCLVQNNKNVFMVLHKFFLIFKIVIEATKGNGPRGDISIDDIQVTNGQCGQGGMYSNESN